MALPLVRPALVTVVLLTFIGPWNEFLWPFLITKRADLQPLAVSLANYISNVAGHGGEPVRRDPGRRGGAGRAGRWCLFIVFQRYFVTSDLGSGVKG